MFNERVTNRQLRWISAQENRLSIAHVCLAAIAALASQSKGILLGLLRGVHPKTIHSFV
jgi:hypothetical protein